MSRSMYTISSRTKNIQTKYTNQLARELSPNVVTGNIPFITNYGGGGGGGGGTVSNVDLTAVTTNIIPTTNGSQNLGDGSHRFGTTFTNNVDIAGTVTGQIVPVSTNGSQNLGATNNRFGTTFTNNVDIAADMIPATTSTSNLGTNTKVFGNLHIKEITVYGNVLPPEQNYPARAAKLGPTGAILEASRPEVSSSIQVHLGGPDHYYGSLYAKEIFTAGNTISLGSAQLKSDGDALTMPAGSKIGGVDPGTIVIKGNRESTTLLPNATGGSTNETGDGYVIDGNLWVASIPNSTLANGWVSVGAFRGPKGDQGAQGIQGIQGSTGNQGIQGPQGNAGSTGATGPQGPAGVLDTTGAVFSGTITMPDLIVTGNSAFGKSTSAYRVDVSGSLNATSILQNGTAISSIYATTSSLTNYYTKTAIDSSINGGFYNKTFINANFYNKSTIDSTLTDGFYSKTAVDSGFYSKTAIDASLNDGFYNKTAIDANMGANFYNKTTIDSSLNTSFYNKRTIDASINNSFYNKTSIDASLSTNFYNKAGIDASLNTNFYNKVGIDSSLNANFYNKTMVDSSLNTNFYNKAGIDASLSANFYNKTAVDANLTANYYTKTATDSSINSVLDSYYTKGATDSSINSVLGAYYIRSVADSSINSTLSSYVKTSTLSSYYTKVATDSSINSALASYAKTTYVDTAIQDITNVSPATLTTLNEIAAATQGDASFGLVVYRRLDSADASINTIRGDIQTLNALRAIQDPSINELVTYNATQDATISALPTKAIVDASLSRYYTKIATDSSINTLVSKYYTKTVADSSINTLIGSYYTKTAVDGSINSILGSYALTSTLNNDYYTKVAADSSINDILGSYALASTLNDSYYTKVDTDSSINTVLGSYALASTLDSYYTKNVSDASINSVLGSYTKTSTLASNYYTKVAADSSINSTLSNFARTSALTANYYNKAATETLVNTALGSYATVNYVDTQITNFTNVSPTTLNTIAEIAAATQGDASFGLAVYTRINSADASINDIRAQIAGVSAAQDPSINEIISYNSSQDTLINSMLVKADFDASMNDNYYSRVAVDSSLSTGFYNKATTDLSLGRYLLKTAFDSSLNSNYYSRSAIDSSLNTNFYNKTRVDSSLNLRVMKTDFDASMSANYYSRSAVDASLNAWYYNKTSVDNLANLRVLKTDFDASLNANYYDKTSVDTGFYSKTTIDASLNTYFYDKTTIDGSLNTNFYNKTAINTTLGSYLLKTTFDNSMNTNYYNKSRIDLSINSIISNYSTISYVDGRFTTLTGVAPSQLDTLAEIATALQGDASFGMTVYAKITATDSSVNTIRINLANTDSSVNTIRTNLAATDSSVNTIRTGLSNYIFSNDASLVTIRASILQITNTGTVQDPSVNELIAYNVIQDTSINLLPSKTVIDNSLNNYYTKTTIDSSLNDNFFNKTTTNSTFLAKSEFDSSMNNNYYTKTIIDSSLNDNFFNKTTTNSTFLAKSEFDTSMNNNYYTKTTIDSSLNDNFFNKTTANSTFLAKSTFDTSMNNNYYTKTTIDSSLNDNFYNKTTADSTFLAKSAFDTSMNNNYYTKTTIDSSLNDNFYNKTTADSTFLAKSDFDSSMNNNYYTKTMVDASLANYSTITYVDGRFTTLTGVAPSTLDTLAEIATALQGDASFGTTVYNRINSCDSSINTIRTSLTAYLQSGSSSDISLNGNVQLGNGSKTISINKTPNALYSLDVSGSAYVTNNIDMSGAVNAMGFYINGDIFDSASDGISTVTYGTLTALETVMYSAPAAAYNTIATSSDGKYITATSYYGNAAFSNNYGATFTDISNIVLGGFKFQPVMSSTGQYQYLAANGTNHKTSDYGVTWVSETPLSFTTAVSGSGKYVLKYLSGSTMNISSNFGVTYAGVNIGAGLSNIRTCAMSKTGQIMVVGSNSGAGVKLSQNFGRTWNMISTGATVYSISISASGRYILAGSYLSNNFGISFEALPAPANITSNLCGTAMSANGQYMAISNTTQGFYSLDYGKTWVQRASNGSNSTNGTCMAMTSNGGIIYQATTTGVIRLSASQSMVANSLYVTNNIDMSGSINAYGNVQLGDGARFMGINKLPNALFALDISGSTNMSGNLSLTKRTNDISYAYFDMSAVNMSVFNVSEKFTTVALSATPTLDYSTGGIFYMPGVNAALTTISITNVPTTLNRSISVTLILAQTGAAGTFCFTAGTLNVNGTAITYLKPDATALAAPSANRSVIINQFIIIWVSATPTVIAYLSSMG